MATYLATIKFNREELEDGKSFKHAARFLAEAKRRSVKIRGSYWTAEGQFDGIIVFEAPDEKAAAAAMFYLADLGSVHVTKVPSP